MITYDDSNLMKLFRELSPENRLKAIKGALRRQASKVRRTAVNNLRGSIRSQNDQKGLESGVRAVVFKRKAGFRVTVGTKAGSKKTGKGERGIHTNRRGLKKPVLIWAEEGTKERHTKTATKIFTRSRKGHSTGRMKRYGFLRKTLNEVRGTVTDSLHNEIIQSVTRISKKYGCT